MKPTTKIWLLRVFLFLLAFIAFVIAADNHGSLPLAVTFAGLIYTFFKNPFEKTTQ